MNMSATSTLTVLATLFLAVPAFAQTEDEPLADVERRIADVAGDLDWEQEFASIKTAINNVWQQNEWDDEPHRFARDLALEVAAIPPWQFMQRFERFNQRVAERYDLSPRQRFQLQGGMIREAGRLLINHADMIFEQAGEILEDRRAGRPFDAEDVARWTKESDPLTNDVRATIDRLSAEMRASMSPEQRQVFDRDFKAFEKRWARVQEMRSQWAEGKWKAEDWGLQEDPQQSEGAGPADSLRGAAASSPLGPVMPDAAAIPRWVPHDPSTWFAYVLDVKKRYRLDAGQMTTAESIHAELVARATTYASRDGDRLLSIPEADRAVHPAYEPIRDLFQELRDRLDAVPTTAQRESATPPS